MEKKFSKIAVVGLGLLGGSICKAVKNTMPDTQIVSFGRNLDSMKQALIDKNVDSIELLENISVSNFDIFIVALPVEISKIVIKDILNLKNFDESVIVIDVGSVKKELLDYISNEENSSNFIGCHPMAGSEKTGYISSSFDLYKDATVVITPIKKNRKQDIEKVEYFWKSLGANVIFSSPKEHDLIVAYISHMPHIVAASIVNGLYDGVQNGVPEQVLSDFIGGGFRDVTRVASGSPDMWRDIVLQNSDKIEESIKDVISNLSNFLNIMKDSEKLYEYFSGAKKFRDKIMKKRIIVAIDGPAGSGKSSVSKVVAIKMGLKYIDSGAIYRSITLYLLEKYGEIIKIQDKNEVFNDLNIRQEFMLDGNTLTFLNDDDISVKIRDERITLNIGKVSEQEVIREYVTNLLKEWSKSSSVIMDGRDISTVVFPNADLKVYFDASVEERTKRRVFEYTEMGKNVDENMIKKQITQRDSDDKNRQFGALKQSEDAVYFDTSDFSKEKVIEKLSEMVEKTFSN